MLKKNLLALVSASVVLVTNSFAANFADEVVGYEHGATAPLRFTNPAAALGAPSQINPFADPTDPFDPPYGTNQIVSIAEGGSLTVKFHTPILNLSKNPFGLDFIIFGNSGFIITNDFDFTTFDWIGTPATDGSLFGYNFGATKVSVSRDGVNFFTLDPTRAQTVDGLFPTDGAGDPHTPVFPSLTQSDFAGLTLQEIRALYHGSAGGIGYDISWAQDANGNGVFLPEINYVRVDVLSGKSEIDAFAAVFTPRGLRR